MEHLKGLRLEPIPKQLVVQTIERVPRGMEPTGVVMASGILSANSALQKLLDNVRKRNDDGVIGLRFASEVSIGGGGDISPLRGGGFGVQSQVWWLAYGTAVRRRSGHRG